MERREPPIRPKARIRRFDVFVEYTKWKQLLDGVPEDVAKGYAIWLAKVVAARKFGRLPKDSWERREPRELKPQIERGEVPKWRKIGGVPQTDKTFDKEIIQRMGEEFYYKVFSPAIERAVKQGRRYEEIRDTVRKDWVPE